MSRSSHRPGRAELRRSLLATGVMTADWAESFDAVDRAGFLPDVMWPHDMATGTHRAVDRAVDPTAWYAAADANVPITTQWDDGAPDSRQARSGRVPTSSASMPSVVMEMLTHLDVRDGQRVLEIGTGTGWNAALLAHRLGDDRVVTVEVDEAVGNAARKRLAAAGLRPTVLTGDGLLGHPVRAPYDRIVATAGLRRIPPSWVAQTAPGGLIVAPWGTRFGNSDHLVHLVVAEDGRSASGHLSTPVEFMKVRSQRHRVDQSAYLPGGFPGDATTTDTALTASELGVDNRRRHPFPTVAGFLVPDCTLLADRRGTRVSVWLYGLTDASWAAAVLTDGIGKSTAFQSGPRRLWDELSAAHRWWSGLGRPDATRFGLTVSDEGESVWLDAADRPVRPPNTAP